METTTGTALQAQALSCSLTVNDLQQSMRFFEGLGFVVEDRWEEQGNLLGVMMQAGDVHVGLTQDDWQKGRDRTKGVAMRLFISTAQDIDALAARVKEAGIALEAEPHDTEWGGRAFAVSEPSGFKLTIASPM